MEPTLTTAIGFLITIPLLGATDIVLTRIALKQAEKKLGGNVERFEAGALANYLVNKFGYDKGLRYGQLITITIHGFITALYVITKQYNLLWFYAGVLTMLLFSNYIQVVKYLSIEDTCLACEQPLPRREEKV